MFAWIAWKGWTPMANPNVRLFPQDRAADKQPEAAEQPPVASLMSRLQAEFSTPSDAPAESENGNQIAFLSRCVVLQAIGAAFIAGLWIAGLAGKPFQGDTAPLCWIILGVGTLGIFCVFLQRWKDVQWIATHVVRIGLLGTVVGLIIAFSAASQGGSANPEDIKPMISAVVSGMYVSLYATLLGIAVNLWLKVNLRLLGNFHG